jgi:hypothetical protein
MKPGKARLDLAQAINEVRSTGAPSSDLAAESGNWLAGLNRRIG